MGIQSADVYFAPALSIYRGSICVNLSGRINARVEVKKICCHAVSVSSSWHTFRFPLSRLFMFFSYIFGGMCLCLFCFLSSSLTSYFVIECRDVKRWEEFLLPAWMAEGSTPNKAARIHNIKMLMQRPFLSLGEVRRTKEKPKLVTRKLAKRWIVATHSHSISDWTA